MTSPPSPPKILFHPDAPWRSIVPLSCVPIITRALSVGCAATE